MSDQRQGLARCRLCGSNELEPILDLGNHYLSGVFPRSLEDPVSRGGLQLTRCSAADGCGLVQLVESFEPGEMYGSNYGYRSGLNPSMVRHLQAKVAAIEARISLGPGDLVVDIGSNDGTTLAAYSAPHPRLIGVDPSAGKFRKYYPDHVELIEDFFAADRLPALVGDLRARVVTSFSMLYDLEEPLRFAEDVYAALGDDGLWVFEQSYLPAMLAANSYDTVCHEHLEYYALEQILWLCERVGFVIDDVTFNDVNGGSFSVVARKASGVHGASVEETLERERALELRHIAPYAAFAARVSGARTALREFLIGARARGERVAALGASTKGNTILQYCGLSAEWLTCVGEINPDKYGCVTPGTGIPIVPEDEVLQGGFDYLVVLPWHFREFFLSNPRLAGQRLLFPLPELTVVAR